MVKFGLIFGSGLIMAAICLQRKSAPLPAEKVSAEKVAHTGEQITSHIGTPWTILLADWVASVNLDASSCVAPARETLSRTTGREKLTRS